MINELKMRLKHILKTVKFDIIYYFFCERIHNKVAVTVEKDLSSLLPVNESLDQAGVKLVAITPESMLPNAKTQPLIYPDEKRLKTAIRYLNKGYRGVALVREKEVIGDIWYTGGRNIRKKPIHPDLKWLGIECKDSDAYAFDMYLPPDNRGKNLANLLQNGALHEIRKNGYSRALGYYWLKNIPALWVHRTLQWKQLGRVKVFRFLFLRHSQRLELRMQ